jgi:hypothetical protein
VATRGPNLARILLVEIWEVGRFPVELN